MKRGQSVLLGAACLWLVFFVTAWQRAGVLDTGFALATTLLSLIAASSFTFLRHDDEGPSGGDPLARLTSRKACMLWALICTAACTCLFHAEVVFAGKSLVSAPWFNLGSENTPTTAGFGHTVDPWAGFLIEGPGLFMTNKALAAGEIPFWNPFEACGTPYAANGEMGVFSILQLPLHLAPSIAAWDAFALVRIILASWGAWLTVIALGGRERSGAMAAAALGTGAVFTLFNNLVHLNTALVIPWLVIAAAGIAWRVTPRRLALFTAVVALGFNGGNPQPIACALVLIAPALLLLPRGEQTSRAASLAGFGLCSILAAAMNAAALMPLADLLARSENRTFYALQVSGTAPHLSDWLVPGGPLMGNKASGLSGPPWWRIGSITAFLSLSAFFAARPSMKRAVLSCLAGLALFHVFAFLPVVAEAFASLPVVGGLKWTKYAGSAHVLLAIAAAGALDGSVSRNKTPSLAVGLIGAVVILLAGSMARQDWSGILVTGMVPAALAALALMVPRARYLGWILIPILLLGESSYHKPVAGERGADPQPHSGLIMGSELSGGGRQPMTERNMAYRDAVAPLLSGLQGWYDIRSVGAFPLSNYHGLMAPYMNCGPWPPYMLLGASREIILSPYFDLTGVRHVIFREGDFDDMVRERREDLLENNAFVRFGEFQRALDYSSITTSNLVAPDAFKGSFLLLPSRTVQLKLRLAAEKARIGFRFESVDGNPFHVRAGFNDDVRTITDESEQLFEIEDGKNPATFTVALEAESPVRFVLTDWWVKRHITKGRFDFEPITAPGDAPIKILRNKWPIPLARVAYQWEALPEDQRQRFFEEFVATGANWDHRKSLVLPAGAVAAAAIDMPADPPSPRPAQLYRVGWNRMEVDCETETAGWLNVAVTWDPGWKATLDGRELPVVEANGAFIAVPLTRAGKQTIVLEYRPPSFNAALLISAAAAGLFLILFILSFRRPSRSASA